MFAEKTRALYERTRPRDLYDVAQLVGNFSDAIDFAEARALFGKKCAAKSLATPTAGLSSLVVGSPELVADWEYMLGHQLPALPPLAAVLERIDDFLSWLDAEPGELAEEVEPATAQPAAPALLRPLRPALPHLVAKQGEVSVAPSGITYWGAGPLELVRFAGANRLMVEFTYRGKPRMVEPYVLRRPGTGNLLLYAWEQASNQIKAFKVAEMIGLRVSTETFVPRYAIELTSISETLPRSRGARSRKRKTR